MDGGYGQPSRPPEKRKSTCVRNFNCRIAQVDKHMF